MSATTPPRSPHLLLAVGAGVLMTGHGMGMPIFAIALEDVGWGGAASLAVLFFTISIAQSVLSPPAGRLADHVGRRPLLLFGAALAVLANLLFANATAFSTFVVGRVLQGAALAGFLPAALSLVDEFSPPDRRAARLGVVMAGYGAGFAVGPLLGGLAYDAFGGAAPFTASALLSGLVLVGLLAAPRGVRGRGASPDPLPTPVRGARRSWWGLFGLELLAVLPLAFVEPELVVFAYGPLGLTATQFGLLISTYGVASVLGQAVFGGASDRHGRRPVTRLGFALSAGFYVLLAMSAGFPWLLVSAGVAGLGTALINPALTAAFLDGTDANDRSRAMGVKQSANGLGYALGPLLALGATGHLPSQVLFGVAVAAPVLGWLLAGGVVRERRSPDRAR